MQYAGDPHAADGSQAGLHGVYPAVCGRVRQKLVDLVHSYGKRAYVFYDDSWVGVEPYGPHFKEFGFDGVIKCVFSGYEARMCAGVDAPVHELRFHPYLFPVGLGGAPTFALAATPPAMQLSIGTMSAAPCCGPRSTASAWAATCTFE